MADRQLREFAPPLAEVKAGHTLIRSMPTLGVQKVHRRPRMWCDFDMPKERRKDYFRPFWEKEIALQAKHYKSVYIEGTLRIEGPYPHFDAQEPGTQYGDDGDSRLVGREMTGDIGNSGLVDYYFHSDWWVKERVSIYERQDIEEHIGKKGVRAFRDRDFAKDNWTVPTNDN